MCFFFEKKHAYIILKQANYNRHTASGFNQREHQQGAKAKRNQRNNKAEASEDLLAQPARQPSRSTTVSAEGTIGEDREEGPSTQAPRQLHLLIFGPLDPPATNDGI